MSAPVLLAVGLVGGLGALARFTLDGAVAARLGRQLPFGTLAVNLSGAFALGVLAATLSGDAYRIAGTGFLGAYTTFSTFAFESVGLSQRGRHGPMLANLTASVLGGAIGATIGILLATLVNRQF